MPSYLPQIPCLQLDDELTVSKNQLEFIYKPRDGRKVQSLEPVFTLEDLRQSGSLAPRGCLRSSLAYPGLSPNFLNEPLAGTASDDDRDDDDVGLYGDGGSSEISGGRGLRCRAGPRSPSPDQAAKGGLDLQRYNATAAARASLLHEKPAVVDRMEKGVAACAVLRDNRHFRLLSLGVFLPAVNEVRTRSMHRVELHKHLSSTNLRAPQGDKEVRSAVQHDTVGNRLERMYNRVLRSLEESAPSSPGLGGGYAPTGAAGGRRAHGAQGQAPGQQPADPTGRPAALSRAIGTLAGSGAGATTGASASAGGAVGGGGGGCGRLLVSIPSMVRHAGGPAAACAGTSAVPQPPPGSPTSGMREGQGTQKTALSSDYWMRVTLPPEVIEAQLRHLAATTEANLKAYHDRVAAAQDALLQNNGLFAEALSMAPEQVEQRLKMKLGQIQEDTTVNNYNYSSLSREAVLSSRLSVASKQLLTAATLPQFIRAALDHVQQHQGELEQLRSTNLEDGKRHGARRRARRAIAVPNPNGQPHNSGGRGSGGGGDSARMYGSDSARTTASGATDGGPQDSARTHGSEASSESGVWPSFYNVRQRAASAGPAAAPLPPEDPMLLHLEHLRRHASPDPGSVPLERRWSPPPPVMAPNSNSRLTTAATSLAAATSGVGATAPTPRRVEGVIDESWLQDFRDQLEDVEDTTPDSPPEGLEPLPPLPPGDMDAGAYVRSRLQRLWTVLDMPPAMQLDLVLAFTGRDRALLFARHLELWEQAAAAVRGREAQVEALVAVQREIEAGGCGRLSLSHVAGLCLGVLRHTRWLEVLSARLLYECGWALSYHGKPYPGAEAITPSHLLAFMEQLRQAAQGKPMRP